MKVENFMDFLSLGGLGMLLIGVIGKALCCDSDEKEEVEKENEADRKVDEESDECSERGSDEDRPSKDGWFSLKTGVSETDPRICSGCVHSSASAVRTMGPPIQNNYYIFTKKHVL